MPSAPHDSSLRRRLFITNPEHCAILRTAGYTSAIVNIFTGLILSRHKTDHNRRRALSELGNHPDIKFVEIPQS